MSDFEDSDTEKSQMEDRSEDVACSVEVAGSSVATPGSNEPSVPRVVKFAYRDFTASGGKWRAKCTSCQRTFVSTPGVTTPYTK